MRPRSLSTDDLTIDLRHSLLGGDGNGSIPELASRGREPGIMSFIYRYLTIGWRTSDVKSSTSHDRVTGDPAVGYRSYTSLGLVTGDRTLDTKRSAPTGLATGDRKPSPSPDTGIGDRRLDAESFTSPDLAAADHTISPRSSATPGLAIGDPKLDTKPFSSLDLAIGFHRLETKFFTDHVQHTTFHSDATQGRRRVKVVKNWYRDRQIGHGSFGTVFLERSDKGESRAVKVIAKDANRTKKIDYRRELMAMAILAKVRDVKALASWIAWLIR